MARTAPSVQGHDVEAVRAYRPLTAAVSARNRATMGKELHTDELPHPPTLGTKQRWAKHHYQFTKNNQKTQTKSHQSTLLFTSSHSFFWGLWNDDHILQKGRQQQHSLTILFQTDRHKQKSLQTRQGLPHKANSNHQGHAATQQGSKPPTCFHFIFFLVEVRLSRLTTASWKGSQCWSTDNLLNTRSTKEQRGPQLMLQSRAQTTWETGDGEE